MPGPRCGAANRVAVHMCSALGTLLIPVSPRVVAKLLFVSVIPISALDGRAIMLSFVEIQYSFFKVHSELDINASAHILSYAFILSYSLISFFMKASSLEPPSCVVSFHNCICRLVLSHLYTGPVPTL